MNPFQTRTTMIAAALLASTLSACGVEDERSTEEPAPLEETTDGGEAVPDAGEAAPDAGEGTPDAGEVVTPSNPFSRILRDVTTPVVVALNSETVFCTARGYSEVVLKISVPDLDWLAYFDHRVEGENLPCMTAGVCTEELTPESLINPAEPLARMDVRVVLTEHIVLDHEGQTCVRSLDEVVTGTLRGQEFTHYRAGEVAPSDYATCVAITNLR